MEFKVIFEIPRDIPVSDSTKSDIVRTLRNIADEISKSGQHSGSIMRDGKCYRLNADDNSFPSEDEFIGDYYIEEIPGED